MLQFSFRQRQAYEHDLVKPEPDLHNRPPYLRGKAVLCRFSWSSTAHIGIPNCFMRIQSCCLRGRNVIAGCRRCVYPQKTTIPRGQGWLRGRLASNWLAPRKAVDRLRSVHLYAEGYRLEGASILVLADREPLALGSHWVKRPYILLSEYYNREDNKHQQQAIQPIQPSSYISPTNPFGASTQSRVQHTACSLQLLLLTCCWLQAQITQSQWNGIK